MIFYPPRQGELMVSQGIKPYASNFGKNDMSTHFMQVLMKQEKLFRIKA